MKAYFDDSNLADTTLFPSGSTFWSGCVRVQPSSALFSTGQAKQYIFEPYEFSVSYAEQDRPTLTIFCLYIIEKCLFYETLCTRNLGSNTSVFVLKNASISQYLREMFLDEEFHEIYIFCPICVIKIYVNWNHLLRRGTPTLGVLEEFRFFLNRTF